MSKTVKFELDGVDELLREIKELGRKGSMIENKALKEAGEYLSTKMKEEVPVRTGRMRDSIAVSNIRNSRGKKSVDVGPSVPYTYFVELGLGQPSNPFMARAYESSKTRLQLMMIDSMKKGLGLE